MGTSGSAVGSPWLGVWGDAHTRGVPYLELFDDHRLAGSDGCNRLIGGWDVRGDTVHFRTLASTMMYCEGVDTWLSLAARAVRDGATMTILNESGTPIGSLQKG